MKKILFLIGCIFSVVSCKKDIHPQSNPNSIDKIIDININSLSKYKGFCGDTIIISGENIPLKESCFVKFDTIPAEIISVSLDQKELKIKLPNIKGKAECPIKLDFKLPKTLFMVKNNIKNNITIIEKYNWIAYPFLDKIISSPQVFITKNNNIYVNSDNKGGILGGIFVSKDDGNSWSFFHQMYENNIYFITDKDEGWHTNYMMEEVLLSSNPNNDGYDAITRRKLFSIKGVRMLFVDNDMKTGIIMIYKGGVVYKVNNGKNLTKIYSSDSTDTSYGSTHFYLDINNIWKEGNNTQTNTPFITYCNGNNEIWNKVNFLVEKGSNISSICFINSKIGYCFIYTPSKKGYLLRKTYNGGKNWNEEIDIKEPTNIGYSVFLNEKDGWVTDERKIYRTNDGGLSWKLNYECSDVIQAFGKHDNYIYAVINKKMYRYYF